MAKLLSGPHAGEELAHVARRRPVRRRLAWQLHARRARARASASAAAALPDPRPQVDQRQRPQQLLGLLRRDVGTAAEHEQPLDVLRAETPPAATLGPGHAPVVRSARPMHRVGRDLEQHVGGELLLGMVGQRAGQLVGRGPGRRRCRRSWAA